MRSVPQSEDSARSCGGDAVPPPAIPAAVQTPAPGVVYAGAVSPSETTPPAPEGRRGLFHREMTDEEVLAAYRMGLLVKRTGPQKGRRAKWTDAQIERAYALTLEMGSKRAAAAVDVSYTALLKAFRDHGISIRERKRDLMPPRMAEVVGLIREGRSHSQIAAALRMSVGSVSTQVTRARRRGIDI